MNCEHEWRLITQGAGYCFNTGTIYVPSEFYCVKCCATRRKGKTKLTSEPEAVEIDEITH